MNLPSNPRMITIDQNKRFSESCLWRFQRDYFDQAGIDAWVDQVPFYITSNPYIAECYAEITVRFIRDWVAAHPLAKQNPFYILELGTGSGRFSYYVLKTIDALLKKMGMHDISICYVMSDVTHNNIKYYETHTALKPYLDRGMLDFAIFDMETERPITLLKKQKQLSTETLVNPLIVFANYIFDTISHDAFHVKDNVLNELLINTSTPESNMHNNHPQNMNQLMTSYSLQIITKPYYNDTHLDSILDEYKNNIVSSSFLFPIGSIRAITLLKKLANNKLLLISSDKGHNTLKSLDHLSHPSITFHGSFSMMVNFHAIAQYFKNNGGDYFCQTPRKGIKTSVFCSGFQLRDLPETSQAIQTYVEGVSAADYFTLHRRVSDSFQDYTLEAIAAHLNFSRWDPHIYLKMASRIVQLVEESDLDTVRFLSANMYKIADNYYSMPKSDCVLFEIAVFFHAIKQYKDALHYYRQAEVYVGEQFGLLYNLALCLHNVNQTQEALLYFKKSLKVDPHSKEAAEWVTYIEKQL